jgi:hypothetical protein
MQFLSSNASFERFQSYEAIYTQFYLDETPSLFLFITHLPYHQNCLCGIPFNKNETLIVSSHKYK